MTTTRVLAALSLVALSVSSATAQAQQPPPPPPPTQAPAPPPQYPIVRVGVLSIVSLAVLAFTILYIGGGGGSPLARKSRTR